MYREDDKGYTRCPSRSRYGGVETQGRSGVSRRPGRDEGSYLRTLQETTFQSVVTGDEEGWVLYVPAEFAKTV